MLFMFGFYRRTLLKYGPWYQHIATDGSLVLDVVKVQKLHVLMVYTDTK